MVSYYRRGVDHTSDEFCSITATILFLFSCPRDSSALLEINFCGNVSWEVPTFLVYSQNICASPIIMALLIKTTLTIRTIFRADNTALVFEDLLVPPTNFVRNKLGSFGMHVECHSNSRYDQD